MSGIGTRSLGLFKNLEKGGTINMMDIDDMIFEGESSYVSDR